MRILIHEDTGTRHIPEEADSFRALCGYNGVDPQAYDKWDVGRWDHLDDCPQDFGDLPSDCKKCAATWDHSED